MAQRWALSFDFDAKADVQRVMEDALGPDVGLLTKSVDRMEKLVAQAQYAERLARVEAKLERLEDLAQRVRALEERVD